MCIVWLLELMETTASAIMADMLVAVMLSNEHSAAAAEWELLVKPPASV